jgi:hypothetical protein
MHPLESYLKSLHDIHLSGQAVAETSYYGPIAELLNELGKTLDPKVSCVINLQNKGAGIPDGGLFTADQLKAQKRKKTAKGEDGPPPARGVLEIKGTGADVSKTIETEQVRKYVKRYGQALVTNYRDFALVTRGQGDELQIGEQYKLADNERTFWRSAAHPQVTAAAHGVPFAEYLKRVMLHRAQIDDPKDLAWFLASYARDALARIEADAEQPSLATIRKALEQALGISFSGEKGEHFFRSTLVQTLFYGLFSAWVLWSRQHKHTDRKARFHWKEAAWTLHVPAIKVLFEQLATPTKLGQLGLVEVLEWSEEALNRVDRTAFFSTFEQAQAVQYFYEPFLEAFDPGLRKELGVWYTPHEVVQYMVSRVDTVLREELDLPDGLADPRVIVLDPCCGTGAYLVEVLRTIGETLKETGGDALLGHDLKQAATDRIFGFEILPAPFVVSHLQLNLLLQQAGAPIDAESEERVGVYLTNALTGWEPPTGGKQHLIWDELEAERDAAGEVKREKKILVILGNPPYNGFAGMAVDEERNLVEAYRSTRHAPKPQGQGLNDLYVRFFRMAERKIVDDTGQGVVCFISNYSWLDGLSFTGMRERFLEVFDKIWIDCLNGDKYKTGKLTPDGAPDPSIFSTELNREGIQVGTAVALMVRKKAHSEGALVRFRHLWGDRKRLQLAENALGKGDHKSAAVEPIAALGFPLLPVTAASAYLTWPKLPEVFPRFFPGVQTKRDDIVVDMSRTALVSRMESYFDPSLSDETIGELVPKSMIRTARFDPKETRRFLTKRGIRRDLISRYLYRPFDLRWVYWEVDTRLLGEKSPAYFPQVFEGNAWFSAGQRNRMEEFYQPQCTRSLADHHLVESNVQMFPLRVKESEASGPLFAGDSESPLVLNVSDAVAAYMRKLGVPDDSPFFHAIASLHSPRFSAENSGALRQDWPRIPLPREGPRLRASSALGHQLATLLDPETPASGVSQGTIRTELKLIGPIARQDGKSISTKAGDLKLTAGWGHGGKGGITMPGRGKLVARAYTKEERAALDHAEVGKKVWPALLGETTCDVFLNDTACWTNIPLKVWEYTMGGYQVLKKWLSYREHDLLGRALTVEEARYVSEMARRITALLLLGPALDENYAAVKRETWAWPSG